MSKAKRSIRRPKETRPEYVWLGVELLTLIKAARGKGGLEVYLRGRPELVARMKSRVPGFRLPWER